jgi:plastocyanin
MEDAVKLRHLSTSLVATAAVAAATAGCGSSGSSSSGQSATTSSPSPQTNAGASTSSQSGGSGRAGAVTISNFKFAPATLTVSKGARVTVSNKDSTAHTATADDGNSFDTGDINPGSSAGFTLSKAGTYKYHCDIHPFMHGTLTVS